MAARSMLHAPRALSSATAALRTTGRANRPVPPRPHLRRWSGGRAASGRAPRLTVTGTGQDEELELAVFRFTLGIPGFDDALIPRVVGLLGGALLAVNHMSGSGDAQARTEALGLTLAALGILTPSIEARLKDMDPRRGRKPQAESIAGSANFFGIAPDLAETAKRDLAWASFALLKNTNTAGVMVVGPGRQVLLARGAMGAGPGQPPSLPSLSEAAGTAPSAALLDGGRAYLRDAAAIYEAGGQQCAWLPGGAASLLLLPLGEAGVLCLWSERARALSRKEQQWAAAIAVKLEGYLPAAQQTS
mmetsp:Transcript_35845/g.91580  ORF Transcript_35845/g.91580 Transcript_35845/m.91580 type:complete len:304 (+) Transcript_35845:727-1638(+)